MNTRISMLAAAAAVATMPLLAACGSNAEPQSPSAPPTSQAASQAAPSTAPSTEPAATPSSEPAEDAGPAKAASEKFLKSALTLGYPDKSTSEYLAHVKPTMTERGFATVKKDAEASKKLETGMKTQFNRKSRSLPKVTSGVQVNSITAEAASTKVDYQLTIQQQTDGKWKTVKTSPEDTVNLKLEKVGGKWLVDEAT